MSGKIHTKLVVTISTGDWSSPGFCTKCSMVRTSPSGFSGFGRRGRGVFRSTEELDGLGRAEADLGRYGIGASAGGSGMSSCVRVDAGLSADSPSPV